MRASVHALDAGGVRYLYDVHNGADARQPIMLIWMDLPGRGILADECAGSGWQTLNTHQPADLLPRRSGGRRFASAGRRYG